MYASAVIEPACICFVLTSTCFTLLLLCFFSVGLILVLRIFCFFFFSSRRRHTRLQGDWSSDVCSSDLDCSSEALLVAERRGSADANGAPRGDPRGRRAHEEQHQRRDAEYDRVGGVDREDRKSVV